jgi:uncharacterized protein YchJ
MRWVIADKGDRNESCPGGSGLKYKKCHGLSHPIQRTKLSRL